MARPRKERNDTQAKMAQALSQYGATMEDIANHMEISVPTLRKLYKPEIDKGKSIANNRLAQRLYQIATDENNPNVAALIFLAKTRLGWRETSRLEMTNPDGSLVQMPSKIILTGPDGYESENPDSSETD